MIRFVLLFLILISLSPLKAAIFDADGHPISISEIANGKVAWRPLVKKKDGISGVGILAYPIPFYNVDVCTLFLIDTKNLDGPAYLITNAHCTLHKIGFHPLAPNEVRMGEKTDYLATFNRYEGEPHSSHLSFLLEEISYYTEFGTDIAIFKAKTPLRDFVSAGITPLVLANEKPSLGTSLEIIGVPLLRVASHEKELHVSFCSLLGTANIKNGDYSAPDSVIHGCSSIEGFSGAPLLDPQSHRVLLLNSHGAAGDSSDPICSYASQPCEVDSVGSKHLEIFHNYAQYLFTVAPCFNELGVFDLSQKRCGLPRP